MRSSSPARPARRSWGARPAAISTGSVSVLLAEHEPEVAEMSARYLHRDGLRVRLVTTPELALAELTSGPDAVAVLDLTMPGLDPRRIRRALRTPVIFLVAGPRGPRPPGLARGGAARPPRGRVPPPRPPPPVGLGPPRLARPGPPPPPHPPHPPPPAPRQPPPPP